MSRLAAITTASAGADKLWVRTVNIEPDAQTGAHHHGPVESIIYVVSGRARMRWGERLEFMAEAGPGDVIFVPPYVPHQEINASPDASLSCVVVCIGQEPVVVNLDLSAVEPNPERVAWVDDLHARSVGRRSRVPHGWVRRAGPRWTASVRTRAGTGSRRGCRICSAWRCIADIGVPGDPFTARVQSILLSIRRASSQDTRGTAT